MASPKFHSDAGRPRLVVTGASGLLGHALCAAARRDWSVYAFYRQREPTGGGLQTIQADLTDLAALSLRLHEIRPAAVIHSAAAARVADCEARPDETAEINVTVPAHIARWCRRAGSHLCFTSTDLVFDGRHAPYAEDDPPAPRCVYGRQKVQAEAEVLRLYPRALVCRLPLLFGWAPGSRESFALQMIDALVHGRLLPLFVDEFRTPVDTHSAAAGIVTLLGRARGLLHLGGRTRISRYALGMKMAAALPVVPTMIRPTRSAAVGSAVERSPDCSLDSRRAFAFGYAPMALDEAVQATVARCASGQPADHDDPFLE